MILLQVLQIQILFFKYFGRKGCHVKRIQAHDILRRSTSLAFSGTGSMLKNGFSLLRPQPPLTSATGLNTAAVGIPKFKPVDLLRGGCGLMLVLCCYTREIHKINNIMKSFQNLEKLRVSCSCTCFASSFHLLILTRLIPVNKQIYTDIHLLWGK